MTYNGFVTNNQIWSGGGTGRHVGLKIQWALRPCGFDSRSDYIERPFKRKKGRKLGKGMELKPLGNKVRKRKHESLVF